MRPQFKFLKFLIFFENKNFALQLLLTIQRFYKILLCLNTLFSCLKKRSIKCPFYKRWLYWRSMNRPFINYLGSGANVFIQAFQFRLDSSVFPHVGERF